MTYKLQSGPGLAISALLCCACHPEGHEEERDADQDSASTTYGSLLAREGQVWRSRIAAQAVLGTQDLSRLRTESIWVRGEACPKPLWARQPNVSDKKGVSYWQYRPRYEIALADGELDCPEGRLEHPQLPLRRADSYIGFSTHDGSILPGQYAMTAFGLSLSLAEGEAPPPDLRVSYPARARSVLRSYGGRLIRRDELELQNVELDHVTRSAWPCRPPAEIETELLVPTGARLHFAIALLDLGFEVEGERIVVASGRCEGVRFRVWAELPEGGRIEIFDRVLERNEADRFHDQRVDLGPLAGRRVRLVLATEARGAGRDDHAFFSAPFLEVPQRTKSAAPTPAPTSSSTPPNVVLIVLDTVRADALSCYGNPRVTTPRLDAFAAEGVRFVEARSPSSWTLPTHASLFTSLQPNQHGATTRSQALAPSFTTLAEVFRTHGYRTAAYTDAGVLVSAFGLAQGFDLWDARAGGVRPVVERAKAFLREQVQPFFLFVHTYEVHGPYDPPEPWRSRFVRPYRGALPAAINEHELVRDFTHAGVAPKPEDVRYVHDLYEAEMAHADHVIGELFDELRGLGLEQDTIVVVTSDHGEEFYEHGSWAHRTTLYEEMLRVPLILRFPGRLPAAELRHDVARTIDLAPTLLELADLPRPVGWAGASLLDSTASRDDLAMLESAATTEPLRALRDPAGRKWIATPKDFSRIGEPSRWERYDLGADPGEQRNLFEPTQAPEFERMWRYLLLAFPDRTQQGRVEADLSSEEVQALRALGYLVGEDGPPGRGR